MKLSSNCSACHVTQSEQQFKQMWLAGFKKLSTLSYGQGFLRSLQFSPTDLRIRSTGLSKLSIGVKVSLNGCLSLCKPWDVMPRV